MKMASKNGEGVTIEKIDAELIAFYNYCKELHLTDEEINKVCQPLMKTIDNENLIRRLKIVLFFLLFIAFLHLLTYWDGFNWFLSACGRMIMIKLLPFWDWTVWKNEKCLISNFWAEETLWKGTTFNCDLCESLRQISVETDIDSQGLKEEYLDVHKPVILIDSSKIWHQGKNWRQKILNDRVLKMSIPCELGTNLNSGATTVGKLLKKSETFESYFMHFQNCDFDPMKSFRLFAPKPDFLPTETSPAQYNWILTSKNYNVTKYKRINLKEMITVFGQIFGSNYIKLIPNFDCIEDCPELHIELQSDEFLIFTSLWNFEYKPKENSENFAAIAEYN